MEVDAGGVVLVGSDLNLLGTISSSINRYQVTRTLNNASTVGARWNFQIVAASAGLVDITIRVYGPQLEQGAFASSYIPTTGATATRAADSAIITNLASIGFNPLEGTILAEWEHLPGNISVERRVAQFDNNTDDNRILLFSRAGNTVGAFIRTGAIDQANLTSAALTTINKGALAYKGNDCALSGNGAAAVTSTSTVLPTVDRLRLGATPGATNLNGWLRRLTYFPTRLPDAQLQARTA